MKGSLLPTFRMKAGMLEVTFGRTPTYLAQKAGLKHLDEADRAAVLFIQSKGTVSEVNLHSILTWILKQLRGNWANWKMPAYWELLEQVSTLSMEYNK